MFDVCAKPVAVDWLMATPVISTAHMPHERAAHDVQDVLVAAYEEGAFVYVGCEGELINDSWLLPVREWLKGVGTVDGWVRFDAAGSVVEGLRVYEWAEVNA